MAQERNEKVLKYNRAVDLYNHGEFYDAYVEFQSLGQFMDSWTYTL